MWNPGLANYARTMEEVHSAAAHLAIRGKQGRTGDALPEGLSVRALTWINNNLSSFRGMVTRYAKEWRTNGRVATQQYRF